MFYVYCLISDKNAKFHYYGSTADLGKRLKVHLAGKVRTTNRFNPVRLLGYKEFQTREEALAFEKALKKKASYRKSFIREISSDSSSGSPA